MYGASGDAHLCSEVSGACRGLSFVLEALLRGGRVHIYRDLRAELFLFDKFLSPFWQKLTRCPNKKNMISLAGAFLRRFFHCRRWCVPQPSP